MDTLYTFLAAWNKKSDNLAKLQGAYAVLAVVLFVVAGITSLAQPQLGQSILFFAMVAGLTFVGNGVIWALLRTFAIPHIEKNKPAASRKK